MSALDRIRSWWAVVLLGVTGTALLLGVAAWSLGHGDWAAWCWGAGTVVAIIPALAQMIDALRRGRAGVDLIAVLALAGTLAVEEYLAGALIAIMLATGQTLESAAQRRASRELHALLDRAPRFAHRQTEDGIETVAADEVAVGDTLLVNHGDSVPVDGLLEVSGAALDESALTGEPMRVDREVGEHVRSGVINVGPAFELRATATAADSTYAGIVRLAREAGAERAEVVRLADRYAMWFLPAALLLAGGAWIGTGSPVAAVAVLVVATPCPLLLAVPIALVSGLSRASRFGVVIRDGAALENLARASTLMLDKTGTVTTGRPVVVDVPTAPGRDPAEVLRLAASLDQASSHAVADAVVEHARMRGLRLSTPARPVEQPGRGVSGLVEGQHVEVGQITTPEHRAPWMDAVLHRAALDAAAVTWVSREGEIEGALLLRDPLRSDAPRTLRRLRNGGLRRLVMLTGDRGEPARHVATILGLDEVDAEQSPADKVDSVRAETARASTIMIGDGVNDAPALAAATVGVALGARGATASSEAADVVLTADRIDGLADAMSIARGAHRIAVQSAAVGMALSLCAMGVAALGLLPPAAGALLQEGIDVAAIANALRALRLGREHHTVPEHTERLLRRFAAEHEQLRTALPSLRDTADRISARAPGTLDALRDTRSFLYDQLLPHEHAEEAQLYPELSDRLGGTESTATMSRTHAEIDQLSRRIDTHLQRAEQQGDIGEDQRDDLLATLYGLYAVVRLHFLQEEENYFTLTSTSPDRAHST